MESTNSNQNGLLEVFCARVRNPFDCVRDKKGKDLLSLLDSFRTVDEQGKLFDFEDEPETTLEEIEKLYEQNRLYRRWSQKTGAKKRYLAVPNPVFGKFISAYLLPAIKRTEVHRNSHGGETDWTPKRSLETHLPVGSVLSFDLSNAFNNVGIGEVFDFFYEKFHDLDEEAKIDYSGFLAMLLTVTYDEKRALPQGAPHSMALFNRLLKGLDTRLNEESLRRGFRYTRWVDDLTISSPDDVEIEQFLGAVDLTQRQFPVARHKIFFQRGNTPIYLLGQVIESGRVYKNSQPEREANKVSPLEYEEWLGNAAKRDYEKW